jgi:hypothetical protein
MIIIVWLLKTGQNKDTLKRRRIKIQRKETYGKTQNKVVKTSKEREKLARNLKRKTVGR